ncbi:MAG TPA: DUF5711 family protein [Lachnospiraceae bacterium]|nr:DUF5711 family protein [Lachnospiraceae bacterium]
MSNVREYLRKKESNKNEFHNKLLKHKLKLFYRTTLALIAIATIFIVVKISINNKIYTEYRVKSSIKWSESSDAICKRYNENILSYSKDGSNCTDLNGKVLWNQTYEMQNPMIDMNGDYVAIGDYNGNSIYVMNSSGKKGEIDTKIPLRRFCVSQSGIVVAILEESKITRICVFDTEGNTLIKFETTMEDYGYPVDISISDNSQMVAVSYLYVDSGTMTSRVAFYNFDEVGQNYLDNFVSGYDYVDAVVPMVQFMNDETAFAVADNRLMIYKGKKIPTSNSEIILKENVESTYYSNSYIGLVYLNTSGETTYKMDIYNASGSLTQTIDFNMEYSDIIFHEDSILIYNEGGCNLFNIKGVEKFNGEFSQSVLEVIPTSKITTYTLVTNETIETIELR